MKIWALAALLVPSIAGAAEFRASDAVLSHPSIAPIAELMMPNSELPLKPGRIEDYDARTPFYANPRYDHVYIDLKRDATPQQVAAAAAALLPEGKNPKKTIEKLQRALDRGEEIPLRQFLPTFAKLWTGKHADCDGPNCLNAALLFDGLAEREEYMEDWELENAVDSHFRPLQPGERLRVGDLIAFHTLDPHERPGISHAVRYVGGDYVWHKASRKHETPFTLERFSHVAGSYVQQIGRKWLDLTLQAHRRK
jgi:hypothetical protein